MLHCFGRINENMDQSRIHIALHQPYPNEGADYTQDIGLTPLNLEMFHLAGLNMQDERWNNDVAADNLCFR